MTLLALSTDFHQAFWTIAVGSVCGVSCALLGCYLVLKRMSLLCDAIGHGMLPGIGLAALLTGELEPGAIMVGAIAFGLLTALLTQTLNKFGKVTEDAALGAVFTSLFAAGVIILSLPYLRHRDVDAACVFYGLFEMVPLGDWLGLGIPEAFPTMVLSLVLTLAFIGLLGKELRIAAFDPALATAMGFNAVLLHYLLIGLVAASTVTAFQAVGSVVVLAMFIVPAATAQLLTERLRTMLVIAAAVALISAFAGYFLASRWVLASNVGGMMASVAGLQFLLAVLFAPRHGILARLVRNYQLTLRVAGEEVLAALFRAEEAGKAIPALHIAEHSFSRLTIGLAIRRLVRKGLIEHQETWRLTDKGHHEAASVVRAHRLWEAFLGQNFELPLDHLHAPASRMEHFIGPELQSELARELHQPAEDPHGKTIPPA